MTRTMSFSHYSTLLRCKQLYQYQIVEKLPSTQPSNGNLEFGSAIHAGIFACLNGQDGNAVFTFDWDLHADKEIDYGWKHSHESLLQLGNGFITKFKKGYRKDIKMICGEKRLSMVYKGIQFEGTPDNYAEYLGKKTLFDWKTSSYNYDTDKVLNSLQLNLYALLLEENKIGTVDQLCYFVFNKEKGSIQTPVIELFDREKALLMLDDMVAYIQMLDSGPVTKNPNSCYFGKQKCDYFNKCWGKNNG